MSAIGFENAPVTRGFIVLVLFSSLTIGSVDISFDLNRILMGELWRLLFSHIAFTNMAQAVVGSITLYTLRIFERQMGIKKFGAFIVISYLLSIVLQIAAIVIISSLGFDNYIPSSGPYFIIFSLTYLYYAHVPHLQSRRLGVLGIDISEKSWIYVLLIQLLLSDGFNSSGSAAIGWLIGFIYDSNTVGIQSIRLPKFVENVLSIIYNFLHSLLFRPTIPNMQQHGVPVGRDVGIGALSDFNEYRDMLRPNNNNRYVPSVHNPEPPSEDSISTLMSLGFDRATVIQALQATDNNLDAAANR
uniref:UBA domain-containing protein n=1 Tax=Chromulina nebulosa TaxID=96789 RepID=A0A7S0XF64_9STRA|mmetsp:Transcript_5282/g.4755  ORF Transcript_5282/g.4755 Transcript_5282/m.4755 type:complete len:301 (+) Transcript_5282:106-1008(+)